MQNILQAQVAEFLQGGLIVCVRFAKENRFQEYLHRSRNFKAKLQVTKDEWPNSSR